MTIYAIPALGTTGDIFQYLHIKNAKIIVLDWPKLNRNDTMHTYAEKFLPSINRLEPFYLMGVSLGGMLCSEVSLLAKPKKTIIISSCKCSNEIPEPVQLLSEFPLHDYLGEKLLRELTINSRQILGFDKSYLPQFKKMVYSMQPGYFRNTIHCVANWKNNLCKRDDIIHLHGDADKLLPISNVKPDYVIKGGTHAMVVNNANQISVILNSLI